MKTKILILTSEFPPGPGGIGNHAFNLAEQFLKNNFDVKVLAPRQNKKDEKIFDLPKNFKIKRYPNSFITKFFWIIALLIILVLKNNYKVLIASGQSSLICGSIFSKIFFKKSFAIFHGHELRLGNQLITKLLNKLISRFDKIISVSNFSRYRALESNSKLNISVINNGFDPNKFKKGYKSLSPESNSIKLITLGSLSYRKGQHNVINALPHIREHFEKVEYEMIGNPNIAGELENLAINLGVDDLISISGYLDDEAVIEKLLNADIFIMLSENVTSGDVEGFGISILEANYLGLPAIGSIGCGIEDAIEDGYNGKLVNNKNHKDLIRVIKIILKDYQKFSYNSVAWAKNRTWDKLIYRYLKEIK